MKRYLKEFFTLSAFLFVALAFRSSLASTYVVPTESMVPTILPGDRLFANQAAYHLRVPFSDKKLTTRGTPKRGEIAIFPDPEGKKIMLIKRVIAVGGDTIAIRDGEVILNGKALKRKVREPSKRDGIIRYWEHLGSLTYRVRFDPSYASARNMRTIRIPKDHFFVMGDNRDYSGDSRYFGPVSNKVLHARALRLFFSVGAKSFPYIRWERTIGPLK